MIEITRKILSPASVMATVFGVALSAISCSGEGGSDSDTDTHVDAGTDGDADSDVDTDTDTDSDGDTDADGDSDSDADADVDTDTDADMDTDTDTDTDADADTDTDTDTDADTDTDTDTDGDIACNGSVEYCDRPYNQVSQVCTHNAMSNSKDWSIAIPTANQGHSFIRQLDDGVRCMMLDTFEFSGYPALCHSDCLLSSTRWIPMLKNLALWLEENPGEIVTFILESNISEEATQQALVDGQVWDLVYHHDAPAGSPWPTLGWMVENNQRLVVFTDDSAANGEWHLLWSEYGWETPYDDSTFTCEDNRGDPLAYDNQIFILNHYTLCALGGCASNGRVNNAYDFMYGRALDCWQTHAQWNPWGQIPTFLNVDHYQVPAPGAESSRPDVFDVADSLNAAWTL